jgi:hypothetical protein
VADFLQPADEQLDVHPLGGEWWHLPFGAPAKPAAQVAFIVET